MDVAKKRGKIIFTLRERRYVEEVIRSLAHSLRPAEGEARRIAGMGDQVIPALTGLLDTSDPRLLGALGLVATHLDRDEIAGALRDVAICSACSDRVRLTALLILERLLGEALDDSLYQGLESPERAVAHSLAEMAEYAVRDRGVLHEYVRAAEGQSGDVIRMIVDFTFEFGPERAVLPFWALAQSRRHDVAEWVLHCLGRLRSPEAGTMLQALLPTLPPGRRVLAQRSLRKLQLSGVDVPPLRSPNPAWRALISPIDGQGSQSIWFWLDPQGDAPTRVLSLLVNDAAGLQEAGYDQNGELAQHLPPRQPPGTVHQVVFPGASATLSLLEATFDAGRHLVQEALGVSHASGQVPPLSYAVLSDALWKWSGPKEAARRSIEPPSAAEVTTLRPRTADLLSHPAFETWFVQSEAVSKAAGRLGWGALLGSLGTSPVVDDLIRRHFTKETMSRCRRRLERTAEWLWLAGDEKTAKLALVAASTLEEGAPMNHPLAQRMVQMGLAVALQRLAFGSDRQGETQRR